MIWVFHCTIAKAGSCENYDDLLQYISHKEELKGQETHPEDGQSAFKRPWSFTFFTPQQVSIIYDNTPHSLLTKTIQEAHQKEAGFVVMCQGDFESPVEILCAPGDDLEALKKQWCLAYCDAHGYIVIDNFSHSQHLAQSQWQARQQPETEQFSPLSSDVIS